MSETHRGTDDGTRADEYKVKLDSKAKHGDWLGKLIPIKPNKKKERTSP